MTDLADITLLGVSPRWPTREDVVRWIQAATPWSMDQALTYNAHADAKNVRKTVPAASYDPVGYQNNLKAIRMALQGELWEPAMAEALGYQLFGHKLQFFWHHQFRILFPTHSQPLRMMNWTVMTETMAMAFLLGWPKEGTYQGYLTYASLCRGYQLQASYEEQHRRGHAFLLRLFAAWRADVNYKWPPYAYDEHIYEGILERWREPDPEVLIPWLLAACDRHTHEAQPDTATSFHDFSSMLCVPLEILFLFRLRELMGLRNPALHHPLMEAPFDHLPVAQPAYVPDTIMVGTLARVHKDWPQFDSIVSPESIKKAALSI